jgi:hypothetical protein
MHGQQEENCVAVFIFDTYRRLNPLFWWNSLGSPFALVFSEDLHHKGTGKQWSSKSQLIHILFSWSINPFSGDKVKAYQR